MKDLVPAWKANSLSHNWFNEFDQLFDSLFETRNPNVYRPACDIEETEKYILFSLDLPGMKEKDINIEVKDSVLSISGERKKEFSEDSKNYTGRHYGFFRQSFRIPKNVDQDKIEADYTNGELKIALPKSEEAQARKVEVKSKKGHFLSELLGSKEKES